MASTYSETLASRAGSVAGSTGTIPPAFSGATAATGGGGVKVSSVVAGGVRELPVAVIVVLLLVARSRPSTRRGHPRMARGDTFASI